MRPILTHLCLLLVILLSNSNALKAQIIANPTTTTIKQVLDSIYGIDEQIRPQAEEYFLMSEKVDRGHWKLLLRDEDITTQYLLEYQTQISPIRTEYRAVIRWDNTIIDLITQNGGEVILRYEFADKNGVIGNIEKGIKTGVNIPKISKVCTRKIGGCGQIEVYWCATELVAPKFRWYWQTSADGTSHDWR